MSTICIVDDVASQRLIITTMLKGAGFNNILAYGSAEEVLTQLFPEEHQGTKLPFDLLLLDINLPRINGIDVCRQIKNHPQTHHLPVIIVSASLETDDLQQAFEAGAMDFITKPVNKYELIARVRSAIRIKEETDLLHAQQSELMELTEYLEVANKALIEQFKHTEHLLRTMYEIGQALNSSHEVDDSLHQLIKTINSCIPYDAAELCLYDPQQQFLTLRMAANPLYTQQYKQNDVMYDPQQGYLRLLLEQQHGLIVPNVNEWTQAQLHPQQQWQGIQPHSYIGIPLMFNKQILGTIELVRQQTSFTNHDLRFLEGIGLQAAATFVHLQEIQRQQASLQSHLTSVRIDIDQEKRLRQANSIINSDAFQTILRKAQAIRARRITFDQDEEPYQA